MTDEGSASTALVATRPVALDPQRSFAGDSRHETPGALAPALYLGLFGVCGVLGVALVFVPLVPLLMMGLAAGMLTQAVEANAVRRLVRHRGRFLRGEPEARKGLEECTGFLVPGRVHMEAVGILARDALERGDLHAAARYVALPESDRASRRPVRMADQGLLGEVMRSIMAWLQPTSGLTVAGAAAMIRRPRGLFRRGTRSIFRQSRPLDPLVVEDVQDMLAVLQVLEGAAEADPAVITEAWQHMQARGVAARYPGIALIARVAAARRLPQVRRALEHDARNPDVRRRVVALWPEFAVSSGQYRDAPLALAPARRSVALAPTEEVEALVGPVGREKDTPWVYAVARWVPVAYLAVPAVAAVVQPLLALVFLAGGALPLWLAGREAWLRTSMAPLYRVSPRPPRPWQREFRKATGRRHTPRIRFLLYVSCVRAEALLREGSVERALDMVRWRLESLHEHEGMDRELIPVGGLLITVAALALPHERAEHVLERVPSFQRWSDLPRARTHFGNAPAALALAEVLVAARAGQWGRASRALGAAASGRRVWVHPFWTELLSQVASRCAREGHPAQWPGHEGAAQAVESFVTRCWPELRGDRHAIASPEAAQG